MRMLGLEIEYLAGTVIASRAEDEARVDWPPQPDRVFSALVASWDARGSDAGERGALEWLERQEAPRIISSDVSARSTPTVFVPPNDFKTTTSGSLDVIPVRRRRQARRFPTGRPHDAVVRLVWSSTPDVSTRERLDALARDTAYIGHSTSLTRCRFIEGDFDLSASQPPMRSVYGGRLRELERLFYAGRRPNPGAVVISKPGPPEYSPPASVFSSDWIILADDGGRAPDLRASPLVAREVRDALMGSYQRAIGDVPEWLSGHTGDGKPSPRPHLAVVPLADVGWQHSEGRFMGCAIVFPREISPDSLTPAIAELLEARSSEEFNFELHYGPDACWYLQPTESPQKASLRPARWIGLRTQHGAANAPRAARLWTTATPLILDRFPKNRDREARAVEIREHIIGACRNIGLPAPTHVSVDPSSGLRGVPRARVDRDAPAWQRWQVPHSLAGRYLTHATVGFDEPVQGPVIIGAGRYAGLGLCLPVDVGAMP